ncbi:MAG TPA: hypothetical protein VGC90_07720 [Candidatus Limnocylindrales bacterium]
MRNLPGATPGSRVARGFASIGILALATAALLGPGALAAAAGGVGADHHDANGNNGTVKIHDGAFEPSPEVKNQPHVCTFHIHFFFADKHQAGSWKIEKWAPGPKGAIVLTGAYDTGNDGEDRQPEVGSYSLPDGHYKLFWNGDTDKHDKMKVFWVKCTSPKPTPTPTPSPTPTPTPTPTPSPTPTPTPTPVPTPTPTPVPTPTPTPSPTPVPTPTPTPVPTPTPTPVPTPTPTPVPTPTPTPVPTPTPTPVPTPTPPAGGVGGVVGTPRPTVPPTDTANATRDGSALNADNVRMVLLGLVALFAAIVILAPTRVLASRRIRRR